VKNEFDNIDQLFKNTFENYEANVDASVWNTIQQSIGVSVGNAAASSVASKSVLLKIASAIIISSAVVATSILVYNNNKTAPSTENSIIENENNIIEPIAVLETQNPNSEINTVFESTNIQEPNTEIQKEINRFEENTKKITAEKEIVVAANNSSDNKINSVNENKDVISKSSSTATKNNENTSSSSTPTTKTTTPEPLAVELKTNTTKGDAPLDVEFFAEGNAVKYRWNFNDGTKNSDQQNAYHTFLRPGIYVVSLEVKDNNNQTKTLETTIEVTSTIKSSLAEIPTIFTPNNDGKNDILKIEGENIESFQVSVLNQNGKPIFEWNTIDGFWDGRDMNNNILPDGTYYISGVAIGVDGVKHLIKQSITLRK